MSIYYLIYVSRAERNFSEAELMNLLQKSREKNKEDGLTGMLLYKDGRFMQVLEGEKSAVLTTYARIEKDSRHSDIVTLLEGELAERDFPEWWMGFKILDGDAAKSIPGFYPFLDLKFAVFDFASDPSRAHQLLRMFRRM